jgi:outer membrane lipoprotein SlyB
MLQRVTLGLCLLTLIACQSGRNAGYSGPIIDPQGVDMARYQTDLSECQAIAEQVPVGERAVAGAATGAVLGGAVGAVVGNRNTAARGAGVGAIGGGVRGASSAMSERDRVVHNCLRGRGYRLLN